jgi:hypothetical protein
MGFAGSSDGFDLSRAYHLTNYCFDEGKISTYLFVAQCFQQT